jgi:death-on-curing protein
VRVEFLTVDDVLALHADQIAHYGGSTLLRDLGLLESALAMPAATFGRELLHPSIDEQAAAYLFYLVKNHPFVDGNKRTGLVATLAFLGLNDIRLEATDDELVNLVTGVAAGRITKAEVAVFVRRHRRRRAR